MNKLKFVLSLFIAAGAICLESATADTTIVWQVMSGGGTNASNSSYILKGTFRQTAIRLSTTSSYADQSGFWPYIRSLGPCCIGIRGNCNGDPFENLNILDHTFLVDRIFRGGPAPSCFEEGDVNGDGSSANIIDLNYLTAYFYQGGPPPPACP